MSKKKVAIIIGASRGIGKAIALKLDRKGFITVLVSRDRKKLRKALKDFSKRAIIIPSDVSKEKEVVLLAEKVVKKFGRIDVLVNNVGFSGVSLSSALSGGFKSIDRLTKKDFNQIISVNLASVFFCMRECIKQMKKQSQGGQIVNINSMVSKVFIPHKSLVGRSFYVAAKAALSHMATAIEAEVGKFKIKIATVYSGPVFKKEKTSGISDAGKLQNSVLKPEDIAHIVWMIVCQDVDSNITEVVVHPLNISDTKEEKINYY